jgi:hypothetical protein
VASPSILRIERFNYGLSAVATLVALFTQTRSVVLGFAVGAGLTCLNFYVLRRLVVRWTADAAAGKRSNASMLMMPKMIALMGACAAAVLLLPINVPAFAAGYSIFIVSIIVEALYSQLAAPPETNGNGAPSTGEGQGTNHG